MEDEDVLKWIDSNKRRIIHVSCTKNEDIDWNKRQHHLGYFPIDIVKRTNDCTINYATYTYTHTLKNHRKATHCATWKRLNEGFARDKDESGATCAQIYTGVSSYYTWVKGMKHESKGPTALQNFICQLGAPFFIRSDNSRMQACKHVLDICRFYNISTEYTEPHHPEQNPAENRIGTLKNTTSRLMDRTGCPNHLWLCATIYCSMLLNVLAHKNLNWRSPTEIYRGYTTDISPLCTIPFINRCIIGMKLMVDSLGLKKN